MGGLGLSDEHGPHGDGHFNWERFGKGFSSANLWLWLAPTLVALLLFIFYAAKDLGAKLL